MYRNMIADSPVPAASIGALQVENLCLTYASANGERFTVLDIEKLAIEPGALVGITGPSGSGKTSLLYALTGIEHPERGAIRWGHVDIATLNERRRDRWRRKHVGLVFQDFHLIPSMSPLMNVLLPCTFEGFFVGPAMRRRALELLELVKAPTDRTSVATLSRGEQQRIGVARALLGRPGLIAADEPTASLDAEAGRIVIDLLLSQVAVTGATLIVVTHDPAVLSRLQRVYHLRGGRLLTP
jgi:putative ABC transport system ATP-binding protein